MRNHIGGSKGGRQGRAPPLGAQILSFSCSFQQKVEKIIPLWELAPPPQENPGSATESCSDVRDFPDYDRINITRA